MTAISKSAAFLWIAVAVIPWVGTTGFSQRTATPARGTEYENLVRMAVQLENERYRIWRENLDRSLDERTLAQLRNLRLERQSINDKVAAIDNDPSAWYQFNERVRERIGVELAPGWNRLMLERFPTPERLRADFPDDLQYYAALITVGYEFTLGRTIRPPRTTELDARDAAYSNAMRAIEATLTPSADNLRAKQRFETDLHKYTMNPAFKREVLGRYIPLFASFVVDEPMTEDSPETPAQGILFLSVWQFDDPFRSDVLLGYVLMGGSVLAAILGPLWWVRRKIWSSGRRSCLPRRPESETDAPTLGLPQELKVPLLPGRMQPRLKLRVGHIVDVTTWTETSVTTTTVQGNQYQPARVEESRQTVQKDRLWLRELDGHEEEWTVTGGVFSARPGHLVTMVMTPNRKSKDRLVLAHNHTSGATYEPNWLYEAHAHAWLVGFQGILFGVIPPMLLILGIAHEMGEELGGLFNILLTKAISFSVIVVVWAIIVKVWVVHRRSRVWRKKYRPRILEILKRFGNEVAKSSASPEAL